MHAKCQSNYTLTNYDAKNNFNFKAKKISGDIKLKSPTQKILMFSQRI